MIHHCVYLSLSKDFDDTELADVMHGLDALVGQIDGYTAFTHGPNVDVEGKSPEAPYGFICTFFDRKGLERYAADPRHKALGAQLVALCGGVEGIKVYDIQTSD